jgi:hypothetical protein
VELAFPMLTTLPWVSQLIDKFGLPFASRSFAICLTTNDYPSATIR